MKYSSLVVLLAVFLMAAGLVGADPKASQAQTALTKLSAGAVITNNTSSNALSILQSGTVGKGLSDAGALLLNNTGNKHTGFTLYSNTGSAVEQPLARFEIANPAWDEEVLYIRSVSPTSRGLIRLDSPSPEIEFVETDQSGAAGKFEVRVQNKEFQFNSRAADDTTFEKKMTMTQAGDLTLHTGALSVKGTKPSEFSGGINVTGGCVAVNGKCLTASGNAEAAAPAPSTGSMKTSDGTPAALDCNSHTERGAMVLDYANHRLYVCNGPDRGWDYTTLSN